jgi:HD-like signal output (HDOD) protein
VEILRETDLTALEAEESIFGVTHADIGGWLAERWNLPAHLVEAITNHHAPTRAAKNKDLVALIHCADVFALRMSGNSVEFDKGLEFDPATLAHLQLQDEQVITEYINRYTELIKADIEQVTQLDTAR